MTGLIWQDKGEMCAGIVGMAIYTQETRAPSVTDLERTPRPQHFANVAMKTSPKQSLQPD